MKKVLLALLASLPGLIHAAATATPTFTLTPTFTPTPAAAFDSGLTRQFIMPNEIYANNGVVLASAVTTPAPGAEAPWVAQNVSRTSFVMGTNTAKIRFGMMIPNDYEAAPNSPNMNVWAYCSTTATAAAITMTLNVARNPMNNLLPSGTTVYLGTATSMTSAMTGTSTKQMRVKLPLSSSARFQAGDLVSFDLQKTGGATTDVSVYAIEVEYDYLTYRKP